MIYVLGTKVPQKLNEYIKLSNNKEKELVYVVSNVVASYYLVKNLGKSKFKQVIIAPDTNVINTPKLVERVVDQDTM